MEIRHELPEAERLCNCGSVLAEIGADVSEQIDYVPAKVQVLRHVRVKYACPGCEQHCAHLGNGGLIQPLAREWLTLQEPKLAPATFSKAVWTLETLIFPGLGNRPISKIAAPDLLAVLRKIEVRGTYETAHRAKQRCDECRRRRRREFV